MADVYSCEVIVAKALAAALAQASSNVDLSTYILGDKGAFALAKALAQPGSKVTNINLRSNMISVEGITALAEALPTSSITRIELGRNFIGDEGAKALAAAIAQPSSKVTHIGLRFNYIGVGGVKALAAALPLSKVTHIDLSNNSVGVEGAKALAAALPYSKVTYIILWNNSVGVEAAVIHRIVSRNKALIDLIATSPPLGDGFAPSGKFDALPNEIMVAIAAAAKSALRYSWSSKRLRDCGLVGYVATLKGFSRPDRKVLYG